MCVSGVEGLEVVSPQGAMYAMVKTDKTRTPILPSLSVCLSLSLCVRACVQVRVDCGLLGFDSDVDLSRKLRRLHPLTHTNRQTNKSLSLSLCVCVCS